MVVIDMFPISEKKCFNAQIESFDWEFSNFGDVLLNIGNKEIKMRYTAFGNINGKPVIVLKPKNTDDFVEIKKLCLGPGKKTIRRV